MKNVTDLSIYVLLWGGDATISILHFDSLLSVLLVPIQAVVNFNFATESVQPYFLTALLVLAFFTVKIVLN